MNKFTEQSNLINEIRETLNLDIENKNIKKLLLMDEYIEQTKNIIIDEGKGDNTFINFYSKELSFYQNSYTNILRSMLKQLNKKESLANYSKYTNFELMEKSTDEYNINRRISIIRKSFNLYDKLNTDKADDILEKILNLSENNNLHPSFSKSLTLITFVLRKANKILLEETEKGLPLFKTLRMKSRIDEISDDYLLMLEDIQEKGSKANEYIYSLQKDKLLQIKETDLEEMSVSNLLNSLAKSLYKSKNSSEKRYFIANTSIGELLEQEKIKSKEDTTRGLFSVKQTSIGTVLNAYKISSKLSKTEEPTTDIQKILLKQAKNSCKINKNSV